MPSFLSRRAVIGGAPGLAVATLLGTTTVRGEQASSPRDLHRTDDEARILTVAREIVAEDWVATLITVDSDGMPRARSVGVNDPQPDLTMWMSTRRTSRKVDQIRAHKLATLHFARDNLAENFAGAYYASFMGEAFVELEPAIYETHAPTGELRTQGWPNFPDDYAAIRFKPRWLEVYGRGISGEPSTWQPQAVVLPA